MEKDTLLHIAQGQKAHTLEDRILKAISNIENALSAPEGPGNDINALLSVTGREYLENQKCLLQTLLSSKTW